MTAPDLVWHGLLFIEGGERHANLPARADPLDIYALCAAACARSLAAHGLRFRLITNEVATLAGRYAALRIPAPELVEHRFVLDVPPIPFRAAHRKLELFRAFSEGRFGPAAALVDIDAVLLRPWPFALQPGVLQTYDITADVAPADTTRMVHDLRATLGREPAAPRWWGGEFIAGDAQAFAPLAAAVERLWPRYLETVHVLRHVGDETVTSAALAELVEAGFAPQDVGGVGVKRWWSSRTNLRPRASLAEAESAALLHLPADKPFLARFADPATPMAEFRPAYRRQLARKLPQRHLASLAERLIGRPAKHVPRLR